MPAYDGLCWFQWSVCEERGVEIVVCIGHTEWTIVFDIVLFTLYKRIVITLYFHLMALGLGTFPSQSAQWLLSPAHL
ncbi:hypothetical protein ASPBRDRAFT_280053 [Aspergillus brasiliensis CBS 101740]|uniref:Uncharacterized protein n=1 Tax=Aspergillus brasiliensis (strain CBS 101740 / IMI 381727 / IBT 21946) TaxID=767769 RepID=A0A1L9UCV2_ASPBC|nr:hypothetical protein ASPBRDRAFT_280053 [Aspergillus brasiliensis CBS 101740]